jgi:hypothetical protein
MPGPGGTGEVPSVSYTEGTIVYTEGTIVVSGHRAWFVQWT